MTKHDLVIRGASIIDGTGADAFTGDIAVDDGVIVEIGAVDGGGRRTLDADGLTVTPGFVDIHTHFDGQATWDPHLTPSCWHGVTTAILGNCGVGFAPVRPDDHRRLVELMEGVEDIPGTALYEGIKWGWETFPEYLDALERAPHAIDVGAMVPHAAVRAYVMGERAHDDANGRDLDEIRHIVTASLEAGALGFSTGRTAGHRDIHGQPVPGTHAAPAELATLLRAMHEVGHGVFQIVPAGIGGKDSDPTGDMDAELAWMIDLGVETGVPITFLVMQDGRDPDGWQPWITAVHDANRRGANIRPQVASRCFGALLGLQSRLNPFQYSAAYSTVAQLPLSERVRRMRNPELRATIIAEAKASTDPVVSLDRLVPSTFKRLFPLGDPLEYEPAADASVAAIAERTNQDPWAVMYDLFLGADGNEFLLYPILNFGRGSYDGLYDMIARSGNRARPRRRRRALGDHLRREHDDVPADALGPRPEPRSAAAARARGRAAHLGGRRSLRTPGSRSAAAGPAGRHQRHRHGRVEALLSGARHRPTGRRTAPHPTVRGLRRDDHRGRDGGCERRAHRRASRPPRAATFLAIPPLVSWSATRVRRPGYAGGRTPGRRARTRRPVPRTPSSHVCARRSSPRRSPRAWR